ncbi:hypothetical protein AD937_06115 [Gluconobacter japonicus]|nr:hypothetical protein AD937_06115 [Gluconobacter japonicus]
MMSNLQAPDMSVLSGNYGKRERSFRAAEPWQHDGCQLHIRHIMEMPFLWRSMTLPLRQERI